MCLDAGLRAWHITHAAVSAQKRVDTWRAEETARWLGSISLQHYAPNFQKVDGKVNASIRLRSAGVRRV